MSSVTHLPDAEGIIKYLKGHEAIQALENEFGEFFNELLQKIAAVFAQAPLNGVSCTYGKSINLMLYYALHGHSGIVPAIQGCAELLTRYPGDITQEKKE